MYWINDFSAVGRCTKEVELKQTKAGTPVVAFSLALPQGKNPDGTQKEAMYADFVAYGPVAERVVKSVTKGTEVFITDSRLSVRKYTDQSGQPRKSHEFIVNAFQLGYNPNLNTDSPAPTPTRTPVQNHQTDGLFDDDYDPGF